MSNVKYFELPAKRRYTEECGLELKFQEIFIRGSKHKIYNVNVHEEGLEGFHVEDNYEFKSWKAMKKEFPTMMDFLRELESNQFWNSGHRQNDRIYYIKSVEGAEGLYDLTETVWFDAIEKNKKNDDVMTQEPKKSKPKKK